MNEEKINIYLCQLLSVFSSKKPEIMMEIFQKFYKLFLSGSKKNIYFMISTLINHIICFMNKLEQFYKYKIMNIKCDNGENNNNNNIDINDNNDVFDIGEEKNNKEIINDYFIKLIKDVVNKLRECISIIKKESNVKAFKYNLLIFSQMNKMHFIIEIDKNILAESFHYFFDDSLNIWQNINISNDKDLNLNIKYDLFLNLCGYIPHFMKTIDVGTLIHIFENEIPNITDINFKYEILINICDIYFCVNKNREKFNDYLNKALDIIRNNIESIDNKRLLIKLINKILYYIEKNEDNKFVSIEILNNIFNDVKKNELFIGEKMDDNLREIYEYYKNTLNIIIQRKNEKKNNAYSSLVI
jgi:hypothetical protein